MNSNMFDLLLPGGIALLTIAFFMSRRRQRRGGARDRSYAVWLAETHDRIKSRQEGETIAFEDYKERLERQRALIERYNREHGRG